MNALTQAFRPLLTLSVIAPLLCLAPPSAPAQWAAYNDHNRGPSTAAGVTTYGPTTTDVRQRAAWVWAISAATSWRSPVFDKARRPSAACSN